MTPTPTFTEQIVAIALAAIILITIRLFAGEVIHWIEAAWKRRK